jgi:hypothetical protein
MPTKVRADQLQKLSTTHQNVSASLKRTVMRAQESTSNLKLETARNVAIKAVPLRVQAATQRVGAKVATIVTRSAELTKRAEYVQQLANVTSEVRPPTGKVAMPATTASAAKMHTTATRLSGRLKVAPKVAVVRPQPRRPTVLRPVPSPRRASLGASPIQTSGIPSRGSNGVRVSSTPSAERVGSAIVRPLAAPLEIAPNAPLPVRPAASSRPLPLPTPPRANPTRTPTTARTPQATTPRPLSPADQFRINISRELTPQLAEHGVPAAAVPAFVAQIENETASGTSRNANSRNNFAGIRGGPRTAQNPLGYRTYPTRAAGLAAYVDLTVRRYPSVVAAAVTGDPYSTAVAMGNSPWAGGHYRLGVQGNEDAVADAGGVVGRVGTEGQALYPGIRRAIALTSAPTPPAATPTPAPVTAPNPGH